MNTQPPGDPIPTPIPPEMPQQPPPDDALVYPDPDNPTGLPAAPGDDKPVV